MNLVSPSPSTCVRWKIEVEAELGSKGHRPGAPLSIFLGAPCALQGK